jgi:hypothetical protein
MSGTVTVSIARALNTLFTYVQNVNFEPTVLISRGTVN